MENKKKKKKKKKKTLTRAKSRYLGPKKTELARYLPREGAGFIRAVFMCEFETDSGLDAIHAALKRMPELKWDFSTERSKGRVLRALTPYREMSFRFFVKQRRVRLVADFAQMGTEWGSNEAYYRRFVEEALPRVQARNLKELTKNRRPNAPKSPSTLAVAETLPLSSKASK